MQTINEAKRRAALQAAQDNWNQRFPCGPSSPRYIACTLDGSTIYTAETAQQISDAVCAHIKENRKPQIAYTFDQNPGYVWPYTTWRRVPEGGAVGWIGTPWKTIDEVHAEVRKQAA